MWWLAAAAKAVGGLVDRAQRNKELSMQDPTYIRKRAEAAGFNPRAYVGRGLEGLNYAPTFGASIADASDTIVDGTYKREMLDIERSRLEMQADRLQEAQRRITFGVPPASPYGPVFDPTTGEQNDAIRGAPAPDVVVTPLDGWGNSGSVLNDLGLSGETQNILQTGLLEEYPERQLEIRPSVNTPATMEVRVNGKSYSIFGSEGEPWSLNEIIPVVGQIAHSEYRDFVDRSIQVADQHRVDFSPLWENAPPQIGMVGRLAEHLGSYVNGNPNTSMYNGPMLNGIASTLR